MINGGVILIHDYFSYNFPGVSKAVKDFNNALTQKVCMVTIGDFHSIAIIKSNPEHRS